MSAVNWRIDDISLNLSTGAANPPTIALQPLSTTNWPGSTATFTTTVTGDAPLSYFWQSNEVNLANGGQISGANTNVLTITSVDSAFETSYRLIVSNSVGAATSSVVSLTILSNAPTIVSSPLGRDGILGSTATFQVLASVGAITGAPATIYQWQSNSVDIADGGRFSGATTPKLTITGLVADDAATYSCVVSNEVGGGSTAGATLTVASSGTLAFWNFNIATNPASPEVYYGVGTAALAGTTNGFFATADDGNDPGDPTKYWGTSQYPANPANPASNKTHGVRFNASTAGLRNVMIGLSTRLTTQASKYSRLQYTTNGTSFIDYPASSTYTGSGSTWDSTGSAFANSGRVFDLSGFPGVANNPNFGFRIVTETENTATYGTSSVTNYVGLSATYNPGPFGTVSYDLVTIAAAVTNGNAAPTIAALGSFSILDTAAPTNITLTVNDAETPGSLSVTAKSFNPAVIPDTLSPSTTQLTITPTPDALGTAPILVTVSDPDGNFASTWFYVTVNPGNFAPTIGGLVNTNALTNTLVSQSFTISDDNTPVGSLITSSNSGNVTLVPNANISITGSGGTRTVGVTGVAGSNGIAPISVFVTDGGGKSATNSFAVMIRSSTNILAVDSFDYDTAGALITNSGFFWQTHSGATPGQVDVGAGKMNLGSPSNDSEDVTLPLFEAPWMTNSGATLYSKFKAKWLTFPGPAGTYFAHFRDTNSGAATGFGARVIASTNIATVGDAFRLSIANGNGWTNINGQFPLDLQTNVEYTVVTRFVLSNGVATLWINPTSEGSTSVTAADLPTTNAVINPINVVGYCFRQSTEFGGSGTIEIDDLVVGTSFAAVTGAAGPTPENIAYTRSGDDLILSWTQPGWSLATGTNVTAVTNKIPGATSPYTNAISGPQAYFRLVYP